MMVAHERLLDDLRRARGRSREDDENEDGD